MRRRVAPLLHLLALGAAITDVAQSQDASRIAGCYSFNAGLFMWTTYEQWSESTLQGESGLIELTTEVTVDFDGSRAFRVRVPSLLDTAEADRWAARSNWRFVAADSILVSWHNGLFGPLLRLRIRGDSLEGQQRYRSDIVPAGPPDWRPTVAERRPCPSVSESVRRRPNGRW